MKRIASLAAAGLVALAGAIHTSAPASAQGLGTQIKDGFIAFYDCVGVNPISNQENDCIADRTASQNGFTTLGDAISAGWMGNTANPRPSGNGVLPSLSPGSTTLGPFISQSVRDNLPN